LGTGVVDFDGETVAALVSVGRAALIRFYADLGRELSAGQGIKIHRYIRVNRSIERDVYT